MLRIVLDTNVLVSATIARGKPRELLSKGIESQFQIITSEFIVRELGRVLHQPRFKTSEDEVQRVTLALMQSSEIVSIRSSFRRIREDPDDDMILNTAYDGHADIIASGDRHLLDLRDFKRIRILSVSDALKEL
jgi:putative PIN family toxin of toxin-antitoxin system